MRLTVSRYYTPAGRALQAEGVHPDVVVQTKADEGGFREKDLEGHLSPESTGSSGAAPRKVIVLGPDAGAPVEPSGRDARQVPDDPSKGDDEVLKVGWQVLHEAMKGPTSP